nr:hypothetical protein [uncultured Allomuricauda sp.]
MPKSDLQHTLARFLDHEEEKVLKLTFAQLHIDTYHKGKSLKQVTKTNAQIHIRKLATTPQLKMTVLDNLVFRFSFWFERPTMPLPYSSKMMRTPQPLQEGILEIDLEKLVLQFTINAPDKALRVQVKHIYLQLL